MGLRIEPPRSGTGWPFGAEAVRTGLVPGLGGVKNFLLSWVGFVSFRAPIESPV